ncbi:organic hydroperoxide resistance protein [Schumannella luteola]|uniref:Ohr subfamily peroxiredoxin n=1 Tax=Schumannella luteola TaxID=472059 RepID=A0A852YH76_9MICO|nr:organic hydroperoxide resistance protein [Schumannella luteola]NYH00502.1 Ohr subfamily peroxiredoxin [Schumannella luteola]TPX06241.1 organic hydroperoxide resistance protein [Schumannella luteola]
MNPIYTAVATSLGDGRNGSAATSDGSLQVELAVPVEMGGPGGATNPEQLFALGYAACFHSALKGQGKTLGIPVEDSAVTAEVGIGKLENGGFGLAVTLRIELGGVSIEDARKVAEAAHQVCPYSNATRGNVEVKLDVEVG